MGFARKILGYIKCVDDNKDHMRVIEGVSSNTKLLSLQITNVVYDEDSEDGEKSVMNEVILDMKEVIKLRKMLQKFEGS